MKTIYFRTMVIGSFMSYWIDIFWALRYRNQIGGNSQDKISLLKFEHITYQMKNLQVELHYITKYIYFWWVTFGWFSA